MTLKFAAQPAFPFANIGSDNFAYLTELNRQRPPHLPFSRNIEKPSQIALPIVPRAG